MTLAEFSQQTVVTLNTRENIAFLLKAGEADLLREWSSISDREKAKILPFIEEARIYTEQSIYHQLVETLKPKRPLSPSAMLKLLTAIKAASSKAQLKTMVSPALIGNPDYSLMELKPYAENALDVLLKVYLLVSYEDAYLYVQTGRVIKGLNVNEAKKLLPQLLEAHSNLGMLLFWYRLASMIDLNERFGIGLSQKEIPKEQLESCRPSVNDIIDAVQTTVGIVDQTNIFPKVVVKMLRESDDLSRFFIIIDSLVLNLAEGITSDEMKIRRRLAFMYLMRDLVDDTLAWQDAQTFARKTT